MKLFLRLYILLALCGVQNRLKAQQPQAASSTTKRALTAEDTLPLYYAIVLAPERFLPLRDTMPGRDFRMYNPARKQLIDWGNLGNLGSPARPLLYDIQPRQGFDAGVHGFDLYHVQPEDLEFYRHARSFSDVHFSQGRNQFENTINARFSRTFSGGSNFSIDYRSINNLGHYRYQLDKHNAVAAGVWVPVTDRYQFFLIYSNNVNRQQENGGIVSDTFFRRSSFSGEISAPVRLPGYTAITRTDDQRFHFTQHLNFTKGNDSIAHRVFRATHTIAWIYQTYKFSDTSMVFDSPYYGDFITDQRGVRNYIRINRLENQFALATFKSKKAGRPSDILSVGLDHSLIWLHQEPADSVFSNLFLTGNLAITPSDGFAFVAKGNLGVLSNFGEYQVDGTVSVGLGKAGRLKIDLLSQRYPPDLLHSRLFVTERLFWRNNFQKPLENRLSASYAIPLIGLELNARTQLINNYLYYDQKGMPAQTTSPVQLVQFVVRENIKLGPFHLDNTVALQQNNKPDIMRLPKWFMQNSLYYGGYLFKKHLFLTVGCDFKINSVFTPDGYSPLIWQFHLQDTIIQQPYPWLDAFIAFKIQSFRFFAKVENLKTYFNKTEVFYQTANYPQPFAALRVGISWRFMDFNTGPANQGNASQKGGSPGRPPGGRGF